MSQRSTRVGGEFPDQHRYVIADALPPTDECADRRDAVRELIVGIDAHRCGCRLRDDDRARVDVIELVAECGTPRLVRRFLRAPHTRRAIGVITDEALLTDPKFSDPFE